MGQAQTTTLGAPRREVGSFFKEMFPLASVLVFVLIVLPILAFTLPGIVSLSGAVVVLSIWMMEREVGIFNLRRLTIPSFYYWMYFAVILIPGFVVYQDEISPEKWRFLFGIESAMLTVPVGIWLANVTWNFRKKDAVAFYERDLAPETLGYKALKPFLILLFLCFALVVINVLEMPEIPLLYLIRHPGDAVTASLLREDAFKLLNSNFTYAYYVVRGSIFPFLALLSFGRYRSTGETIWKRLFWISLASAVFYAALTIEKLPVAAIFALLTLFYYLMKKGKLSRASVITAAVLFTSFPIMVIALAYEGTKDAGAGSIVSGLLERIFYAPAEVLFAYFEIFPNVISFQHGASLLKLAHLMGWNTIDIPNTVGLYISPPGTAQSVSANACFLGNLNADFGLPAVVIGGVIAGFIMQGINIYLLKKPKTNANLAAYAVCMWSFSVLVSSALTTVLLSGGVFFGIALAWILGTRPKAVGSAGMPVAQNGVT
jgi:oligosaccharide repeat unit polymerase